MSLAAQKQKIKINQKYEFGNVIWWEYLTFTTFIQIKQIKQINLWQITDESDPEQGLC